MGMTTRPNSSTLRTMPVDFTNGHLLLRIQRRLLLLKEIVLKFPGKVNFDSYGSRPPRDRPRRAVASRYSVLYRHAENFFQKNHEQEVTSQYTWNTTNTMNENGFSQTEKTTRQAAADNGHLPPQLRLLHLLTLIAGRAEPPTAKDLAVLSGYPLSSERKSTRLNSSHVKISYAVF